MSSGGSNSEIKVRNYVYIYIATAMLCISIHTCSKNVRMCTIHTRSNIVSTQLSTYVYTLVVTRLPPTLVDSGIKKSAPLKIDKHICVAIIYVTTFVKTLHLATCFYNM